MEYKVDSYTLEYIENEDKYYISFEDSAKQECRIEIEKDIFDIYMKSKKSYIKIKNETSRHLEHSLLSEVDLYKRAFEYDESLEENILRNINYEKMCKAMESLPNMLRRRVVLYYQYNFSLSQIARIDNCSKVAVKYSLDTALKKIKNFFI